MDIMADPDAQKVIQPILDGFRQVFGGGGGNSEAASEAVSDEMGMAMMQYMPLRGVMSFAGQEADQDMLENMLKGLNSL